MPFKSRGEDLKDIFVSETELVDRYIGGKLFSWGANSNGRLGDNSTISKSSPVQTSSAGTCWKCLFTGVASEGGLRTDGTLWLWGRGTYGVIGDSTVVAKSSPVQVGTETTWREATMAYDHVLAVKCDGTLWAWGRNHVGQLGDNTTISKSSPIQVGSSASWKSVAGGGSISAAIKTDGTIWMWGENGFGSVGDNSTIDKSSPVQVGAAANWKQVSVGTNHAGAVNTLGELWVWGWGSSYRLGRGADSASYSSPVQTALGGTNWKQVSAGIWHSAAVTCDGLLYTWSGVGAGEIGLGSTIVPCCPTLAVNSYDWKCVATGLGFTAATKHDGTLWTWGCNADGRLGINSTIDRSYATQVAGTTWKAVSDSPNYQAMGAVQFS